MCVLINVMIEHCYMCVNDMESLHYDNHNQYSEGWKFQQQSSLLQNYSWSQGILIHLL